MIKLKPTHISFFFIAMVLFPLEGEATRIKTVNLQEMVMKADRIFVGNCVEVEEIVIPGTQLPATRYTFTVSEGLKGQIDPTIVIQHFGAGNSGGEGQQMIGPRIPGMPRYTEGDEVILFLAADSSIGLTSPIGFSQGAFRVKVQGEGKVVENGVRNLGLFRGIATESNATYWKLSAQEQTVMSMEQGPLDYEVFRGLIQKILSQP